MIKHENIYICSKIKNFIKKLIKELFFIYYQVIMADTTTSDFLFEAKDAITNCKKTNPDVSNEDLFASASDVWEFLNDDEKKQVLLHAIKTSIMKF